MAHGLLTAAALWGALGVAFGAFGAHALVATDLGIFGAVAPIGGAGMIAGWLVLARAGWHAGRLSTR